MLPHRQYQIWRADGNPPIYFGRTWSFESKVLRAHGACIKIVSSSHALNRTLEVDRKNPDGTFINFCKKTIDKDPIFSGPLVNLAFAGGTIQHHLDEDEEDMHFTEAKRYAELKLWGLQEPRVLEIFGHIRVDAREKAQGEFLVELHKWSNQYFRDMTKRFAYIQNHNILLTNNRKAGWGPRDTQPGDKVLILFGCETPVVVRKVGDQYLHIGPAFMAMQTDGSLMPELEQRKDNDKLIETYCRENCRMKL